MPTAPEVKTPAVLTAEAATYFVRGRRAALGFHEEMRVVLGACARAGTAEDRLAPSPHDSWRWWRYGGVLVHVVVRVTVLAIDQHLVLVVVMAVIVAVRVLVAPALTRDPSSPRPAHRFRALVLALATT